MHWIAMSCVERTASRVGAPANARSFVRVRPHANKPVQLALHADPPAAAALKLAVADISAGGVAFYAPRSQAAAFAPGRRVQLSVSLAESTQPLALCGVVRDVTQAGAYLRCGVEFTTDGDDGFAASQSVIVRYVMTRQQELLSSRLRY
jgi:c-di-GMP-binding flagellar brake protein YcgR